MTIVGVLQARSSSRRLPGKVLADLLGRPMILRQVERLERARRMGTLVLATSSDASDDALADTCEAAGLRVHRGSIDDVLERIAAAVDAHAPDASHVVRLTADCPLADPEIVDAAIALHLEGRFDYTSNALRRTYPDGLDVEVVRRGALEAARREARLPSEREHVTPFLYAHPGRFRLGHLIDEVDRSGLRWTVDEPEDLELVRAVYAELYPARPDFGADDVHALLARRPDLAGLNGHIATNEGYSRSLAEDPS